MDFIFFKLFSTAWKIWNVSEILLIYGLEIWKWMIHFCSRIWMGWSIVSFMHQSNKLLSENVRFSDIVACTFNNQVYKNLLILSGVQFQTEYFLRVNLIILMTDGIFCCYSCSVQVEITIIVKPQVLWWTGVNLVSFLVNNLDGLWIYTPYGSM